jgi:hypothetical protein
MGFFSTAKFATLNLREIGGRLRKRKALQVAAPIRGAGKVAKEKNRNRTPKLGPVFEDRVRAKQHRPLDGAARSGHNFLNQLRDAFSHGSMRWPSSE